MDAEDTEHDDHATKTDLSKVKLVFIVEDDEDIGEVLVQVIQQETAHQVMLVRDAFQALKLLQTLKPDLLILDYGLPGMNGLELYDIIHSTKTLEHLPVLFASARAASIREKIKARQLQQLEKPFEISALLMTVKQLLS